MTRKFLNPVNISGVASATNALSITDNAGTTNAFRVTGVGDLRIGPASTAGARWQWFSDYLNGYDDPYIELEAMDATGAKTTRDAPPIKFIANYWNGSATAPSLGQISFDRFSTGSNDYGFTINRHLRLAASIAALSSVRIPHGTAPSSPVDGDVWTTTAGIYVRINSSTVGPLSASTGDMVLASQQTSTGQKIFTETGSGTPSLYARATTTAPNSILLVQNNAGTVSYLVSGVDFLNVGHGGTTSATINLNSTLASPGVVVAAGDSTAGVTFRDAPQWTFRSTYWTGSASANGDFTLALDRTGTGANQQIFKLLGAQTLVSPNGSDSIVLQLVRGTDTTPAADLLSVIENGGGALASINSLGKYIAVPTATTTASMNLPHGTAPSSPTNGDVWTTTAGIYVRVNGATVGPLGTGGGGDALLGTVQTFTRQHSFIPSSVESAIVARHVSGTQAAVQIQNNAGSVVAHIGSTQTVFFDTDDGTTGSTLISYGAGSGIMQFAQSAPNATSGAQSREAGFISFTTTRWTGSASANEGLTLEGRRLSSAANSAYFLFSGGFTYFAAPTTSRPSITLPHGTAPSSPADGDVWTTTGGAFLRINGTTVEVAADAAGDGVYETHTFQYSGSLAGVAPYVGVGRIYFDKAATIIYARAGVNTAPTGSTIICDINKNGTTNFTSTKLVINTSANTGTGSGFVAAYAAGDYMTVDIDQVGSGTPGSDLTVTVRVKTSD